MSQTTLQNPQASHSSTEEEAFAAAKKCLAEIAALSKKLDTAKGNLAQFRHSFMQEVLIGEVFGEAFKNSPTTIPRSLIPPQYPTEAYPKYFFRKGLTRDMINFWKSKGRSALLVGDAGTGKTSIVEQFHNRLNLDLLTMTGCGKTSIESLFGQLLPNKEGQIVWVDGIVTKAARLGISVLINEFNAMPADVQIALNDVAHRGSLISLPENNEQFAPADGFRLFCTINPKGLNDHLYQGRKAIDKSTNERFFIIRVDYGTREEELEIVKDAWYAAAVELDGDVEDNWDVWCENIVDSAIKVRAANKKTGIDHIPDIISTRVMVNWARYYVQYSNVEKAIHHALLRAMTFGCDPAVALKIHQLVDEIHTGNTFEPEWIGLSASD